MPSTPAARGPATRTVDERFLDLVCADDDLLAAEFDAIIAAEWPDPPAERPGHGSAGRYPVGRAARPAFARVDGSPRRRRAGGGRRRPRERAPPRW